MFPFGLLIASVLFSIPVTFTVLLGGATVFMALLIGWLSCSGMAVFFCLGQALLTRETTTTAGAPGLSELDISSGRTY